MNIKKFVYKSVNSTNDIAIKLIKKSKIKAGLIVSEKQKKGRGQRGKKWISHKGNLFATIFFSLDKNNLTIKELTKMNANLIIKLISFYCKEKIILKKPNDILINKKKVCGILQEIVQRKEIKYLVVGIGLNLIKSPNITNYPTTNLYKLTNVKISVSNVSKKLILIYMNFLKSKKFF